jgi:1,4-alpha-glucan branching enzyme
MGGEFGQRSEWNHDAALDWHLLEHEPHRGVLRWVRDLNRLYREEPAMHAADHEPAGFRWVDCQDADNSVLAFLRLAGDRCLLIVASFTPVPRHGYRVGVPAPGRWNELLNSDATEYGGSGKGNLGVVETSPVPSHGQDQSLELSLPPLGIIVLRPES